eukprot:GFYU01020443.1.p1 GENE.GFYU01020443.1~~GFYU01020443.1.p1  ORF type:complete len:482 (-),score=46.90 GFYU01020443.1:68-1408(-)
MAPSQNAHPSLRRETARFIEQHREMRKLIQDSRRPPSPPQQGLAFNIVPPIISLIEAIIPVMARLWSGTDLLPDLLPDPANEAPTVPASANEATTASDAITFPDVTSELAALAAPELDLLPDLVPEDRIRSDVMSFLSGHDDLPSELQNHPKRDDLIAIGVFIDLLLWLRSTIVITDTKISDAEELVRDAVRALVKAVSEALHCMPAAVTTAVVYTVQELALRGDDARRRLIVSTVLDLGVDDYEYLWSQDDVSEGVSWLQLREPGCSDDLSGEWRDLREAEQDHLLATLPIVDNWDPLPSMPAHLAALGDPDRTPSSSSERDVSARETNSGEPREENVVDVCGVCKEAYEGHWVQCDKCNIWIGTDSHGTDRTCGLWLTPEQVESLERFCCPGCIDILVESTLTDTEAENVLQARSRGKAGALEVQQIIWRSLASTTGGTEIDSQ